MSDRSLFPTDPRDQGGTIRSAPDRRGLATPPEDLRLEAFKDLLTAIDTVDSGASIRATRELRRLGFSVCLTTPSKPRGQR